MPIWKFFIALYADWVALMGGILSIVLTALGFQISNLQLKRLFWIIAAVCFFVAAIRVWSIEHQARLETENELKNLTVPKISLSVVQITTLDPGSEKKRLMLHVEVSNGGAPSSLVGYSLIVRGLVKRPTEFVGIIRDSNGKPLRKYSKEDALYEVTRTPVGKGEIKFGILVFSFDTTEFAALGDGTPLTLRCRDYLGKEWRGEATYQQGLHPLLGLPGIGTAPKRQP